MNNRQFKDIDPLEFLSLEDLVSDGKLSATKHTPLFTFCIKFCILKLAKRIPDKRFTCIPTKRGIAVYKAVHLIENKLHKNYFSMPHERKLELIKEYMVTNSKVDINKKHKESENYNTPFHIERINTPTTSLHINSRIKLHDILHKENKRTQVKRRQKNQKWYLENLRELIQHPVDYSKKYIIPILNMPHVIYGVIIAVSLIIYVLIAGLLMAIHPILSLAFIIAIPVIIWTIIHHKEVVNYFHSHH